MNLTYIFWLFIGYYLTVHAEVNKENDNVFGYVLDTNVSIYKNITEPFILPRFGTRYTPMPNNSIAIINQEGVSGIWSINFMMLPRFLEGKNKFWNYILS